MRVDLRAFSQDASIAVDTAAVVPAASAADPVDIWPYVKAGVISGLTVWFLTRWLGGGAK